jgi:hypothetical protein
MDHNLRDGWDRSGDDRYGYGRPYYDERYSGRGWEDRSGYGRRPSYSDPYQYSGRPYEDSYSYPDAYGSPGDPLGALWGLFSSR